MNYLRELTALARRQNLRVFTVGFHVDYWDYFRIGQIPTPRKPIQIVSDYTRRCKRPAQFTHHK